MKKASIFLGAVILAAGLVGCGGDKAAETKAPEKLRVGLQHINMTITLLLYSDK